MINYADSYTFNYFNSVYPKVGICWWTVPKWGGCEGIQRVISYEQFTHFWAWFWGLQFLAFLQCLLLYVHEGAFSHWKVLGVPWGKASLLRCDTGHVWCCLWNKMPLECVLLPSGCWCHSPLVYGWWLFCQPVPLCGVALCRKELLVFGTNISQPKLYGSMT